MPRLSDIARVATVPRPRDVGMGHRTRRGLMWRWVPKCGAGAAVPRVVPHQRARVESNNHLHPQPQVETRG